MLRPLGPEYGMFRPCGPEKTMFRPCGPKKSGLRPRGPKESGFSPCGRMNWVSDRVDRRYPDLDRVDQKKNNFVLGSKMVHIYSTSQFDNFQQSVSIAPPMTAFENRLAYNQTSNIMPKYTN